MNTAGHANDGIMVLVPLAVGVVIAIILFGGPREALDALNAFLREIVHAALGLIAR
jgi:hypothetical protein